MKNFLKILITIISMGQAFAKWPQEDMKVESYKKLMFEPSQDVES